MSSILNAIGNTPLVEIRKLNPNPRVRVLAKLEYFNPGGSVKDRAALYMIEAGEKSGELTRQKTVIEATSGNTGIGLALVCSVKGYRLLLTMSEAVSQERRKILKARGAEILLTPGHLGTDGAIEEAYRLVREHPDTYFMTDQYNSEANWKAHYHGTAPEIWEQTQGAITMFVATMGTTGTLMGTSRRFKELDPAISIVGVEPYLGHKIQGLKNMKEAYCPGIFDKHRLDRKVNIEDEEAYEMARRLASEEGIFVGMSSGAAMAVALKEAAALDSGTVVVLLPDGGERYLSTPLFAVREKVEIRLFNTLSRSKEPFEPLVPGKVTMYSCGPTAHARMHLGECRRFVFADLLRRYLKYRGYEVRWVVNITDYDDKTIAGSEKAGMNLSEFTEKHIVAIKEDFARLGVQTADLYPRASEHVEEMVHLADRLVKKGFAYEKLRSLYFSLSRCPDYGRLSGIDINKIRLGATVDLDEYEKENPRDFTLFKRSRLSELKRGIYVKSDWGNVRPSWHIQCAAMSMKYLGETFDIHTSSREHVFPHHENVLAVAASVTGRPLTRYWIHCDRVLGLPPTIEDLSAMGFSDREIRYWLLSTHYRKPITFSPERMEASRRCLARLDACMYNLATASEGVAYPELDQMLYDIRQGFIGAMDDDLNISAALASIFKIARRINLLVTEKRIDPDGAQKVLSTFRAIDSVLSLFHFHDELREKEIRRLSRERQKARMEKNWALADRLREELWKKGVRVQDPKM